MWLRRLQEIRNNGLLSKEARLEAAKKIKKGIWMQRICWLISVGLLEFAVFFGKVKDLKIGNASLMLPLYFVMLLGFLWWVSSSPLKENESQIKEIEGKLERDIG